MAGRFGGCGRQEDERGWGGGKKDVQVVSAPADCSGSIGHIGPVDRLSTVVAVGMPCELQDRWAIDQAVEEGGGYPRMTEITGALRPPGSATAKLTQAASSLLPTQRRRWAGTRLQVAGKCRPPPRCHPGRGGHQVTGRASGRIAAAHPATGGLLELRLEEGGGRFSAVAPRPHGQGG